MITIRKIRYNIPEPPSLLRHQKKSLLELLIVGIIMLIGSSHICQVCRRVEQCGVSGWLQIDHPKYVDKNGCSVVCKECAKANRGVFDPYGML